MSHNNNRYSFAPAWCDFDGDGWPDLYVANDFGRNNLYRNRDGKFRDEADRSRRGRHGPRNERLLVRLRWRRPSRPVCLEHVDRRRPARHRTIPLSCRPSRNCEAAYRRHTKGNSLYRNKGDGTFEQDRSREKVEMGRWAWGADGFDFDNDGSPEIFVTAGMLTNASEDRSEQLLLASGRCKIPHCRKTGA